MEASAPRAIISPLIDFLCCGGLSIAVVGAIFVYAWLHPNEELFTEGVSLQTAIILGFVINFPHFMASYRLLYRSRDQVVQHKWASTYVPLILAVLVIAAFLTPDRTLDVPEVANGSIVEVITLLAAVLLAWHYTGQGWGMTASFAFIAGIRMEPLERRLIRSGYLSLLVFHLAWAALISIQDPKLILFRSLFSDHVTSIVIVYNISATVALLTIPLGLAGFFRIWQRTGIVPPWRAIAPWVAIYLWYTLIDSYAKMFACLQFFHALQYIIFPIRVEVNHYTSLQPKPPRQVLHGLLYYLALFFAGLLVFSLPPLAFYWGDQERVIEALLAGFIGIHHYVIDGTIWKIRNPAVRRQLFSHLSPS